MLKKYKRADRSGRFVGLSFTLAGLLERDKYEKINKDELKRGVFIGFGIAWGKTYRFGKWSIEPVLQIGFGVDSIEDEKRSYSGSDPYGLNRLAKASDNAKSFGRVFSNSFLALNIGYQL